LLPFSSAYGAERERAVKQTLQTIDFAERLGAPLSSCISGNTDEPGDRLFDQACSKGRTFPQIRSKKNPRRRKTRSGFGAHHTRSELNDSRIFTDRNVLDRNVRRFAFFYGADFFSNVFAGKSSPFRASLIKESVTGSSVFPEMHDDKGRAESLGEIDGLQGCFTARSRSAP